MGEPTNMPRPTERFSKLEPYISVFKCMRTLAAPQSRNHLNKTNPLYECSIKIQYQTIATIIATRVYNASRSRAILNIGIGVLACEGLIMVHDTSH